VILKRFSCTASRAGTENYASWRGCNGIRLVSMRIHHLIWH